MCNSEDQTELQSLEELPNKKQDTVNLFFAKSIELYRIGQKMHSNLIKCIENYNKKEMARK